MSSIFDTILKFNIKNKSHEYKFSSEILHLHFKRALEGGLENEFIIFPSDPGRGKSKGVQIFLNKSSKNELSVEDNGIVIFLSRKEEIKEYISGAKLSAGDFAVLDSQKPADRVAYYGGSLYGDNAPILFVTSQLLQSRCKGSFEAFEEAFYKGKPRYLRIWDEEFLPGDIITLSVDDLASLRTRLRGLFPATAALMEHLETQIREAAPGDRVMVPSIPDYNEAWRRGVISDEQRSALEGIVGKQGVISRSLGVASIVIERRRLPADLAPLFVLDASARVSANYDIMKSIGFAINMLPVADYSYRNAKFRTMRLGAGRSTLSKSPSARQRVFSEVTSLLNENPADEFMIIYNDVKTIDVVGCVSAAAVNPARLSFVKWGDHKAFNRCRHINKVVCIGLLRYSDVGYDKLRMSCLGHDAERDVLNKVLRESEACATMLQGFARSNMRNGTSTECGDCEIYIVDREKKIEELLRKTFPDCEIHEWKKAHTRLSKGDKDVLDYIIGQDRSRLLKGIKRSDIWRGLGMDKSNFAKILAKPDFQVEAARRYLAIGSRIIKLDADHEGE